MKNTLRIALPLGDAGRGQAAALCLSRRAAVARARARALRALGQAYAQPACEAVLHPEDVIASSLQIPALPARQAAAVRSVLEPMILGDMDDLAIGHGARGRWQRGLAWTPREPLRRAWALLANMAARTRADRAADAGTRDRRAARTRRSALASAAPSWSLATPQWAPTRVSRWRPVWRWTAIALRDLAGRLNLYAAQARRGPLIADARARRARMDALRQTGFVVGRRGARHGPGHALRRRPRRLSYADHALTLTLADAGEQAQRVAETPALVQQAAALGLKLERGDKDATWRITPAQP